MSFFLNPRSTRIAPSEQIARLFGRKAPTEVRRYLSLCPRHAVTPLHHLPSLAQSLNIAAIAAKDEGQRLGLKSFKALGGAYTVARLVQGWAKKALMRDIEPCELQSTEVKAIAAHHTVTCATDGNHGRSVAAGAKLFGCKAVIFVHPHVSPERREAMTAFSAQIIEVQGSYDESVAECNREAAQHGWQVVSDTSWPGYEHIPSLVMQGYTVMVDEALTQLEQPPTHVFVQGGVGGLAASVAAHLADRYGTTRPRMIVVEPEAANCLLQSAKAGHAMEIEASRSTIMGMLECYRPSDLAWDILDQYADAYLDLPEESAIQTMRLLGRPTGMDTTIIAGESGGAGLSGLLLAAHDPIIREALLLDKTSRILVFITEGDTAPSVYSDIMNKADLP